MLPALTKNIGFFLLLEGGCINVLPLSVCCSFAAVRHTILAALESRDETKGQYEWLLELLEVFLAK